MVLSEVYDSQEGGITSPLCLRVMSYYLSYLLRVLVFVKPFWGKTIPVERLQTTN